MSKHPPQIDVCAFVDGTFEAHAIREHGQCVPPDVRYVPLSQAQEMAERAREEGRADGKAEFFNALQPSLTEQQLDALLLAEGIDPEEALAKADSAIAKAIASSKPSPQAAGEKKEGT